MIIFLVPAEAQYTQSIIFLYLVNYNLIPTDIWCNFSTSKTSVITSMQLRSEKQSIFISCPCWKSLQHYYNLGHGISYTEHISKTCCSWQQLPWLVKEIVSVFILYIINCLRNQYDYITSQVLVNWWVAKIFTHNPTATSSLLLISRWLINSLTSSYQLLF